MIRFRSDKGRLQVRKVGYIQHGREWFSRSLAWYLQFNYLGQEGDPREVAERSGREKWQRSFESLVIHCDPKSRNSYIETNNGESIESKQTTKILHFQTEGHNKSNSAQLQEDRRLSPMGTNDCFLLNLSKSEHK